MKTLINVQHLHMSYGNKKVLTDINFEINQGGFRIYNINEIMGDLVYRTGAVRAQHRINIGGETYPFLDFSTPRTGVRFTVKKLSLLSYLAKEVLQ